MELDELKASWNAFDKRLAETEIVNMRMVKEIGRCIPLCLYEHAHHHRLVCDRRGGYADRLGHRGMETLPVIEDRLGCKEGQRTQWHRAALQEDLSQRDIMEHRTCRLRYGCFLHL